MVIFAQKDIKVLECFCLVANESETHRDITIKKVVEKMSVSRQALNQLGYHNVDEIIQALRLYVDQPLQQKFETFVQHPNQDWTLFIAEEILPLLYENRDFFYTLYGGVADPSWFPYLEKNYSQLVLPYFEHTQSNMGISSEFLAKLIVRQVIAIFARWMRQEKPDSPSVFYKKFIYLMTHSTDDLLKLEEQK
ncbi:MAG: TetR family transcriptional regulator C-terminal domain-containing protein [Streptococcaceae bacterium]|nr:TetR family transcriptional regulator C-terminal domain-containing protein [Streptococcaceae bacterium]MCL2681453.1 TetR family transcriptional regulator C-terminal domain-containing protein [Streptococcaceae bacterium]MCL2858192.1 TetR family transcriptional regulator C-terminal domain-containing protein [Streptococcaceae bacterium]